MSRNTFAEEVLARLDQNFYAHLSGPPTPLFREDGLDNPEAERSPGEAGAVWSVRSMALNAIYSKAMNNDQKRTMLSGAGEFATPEDMVAW